jgi:hypothetical protein
MIGKHFHSFDTEGYVAWQGRIVGNPEPGWYLVQLYEWLLGEESIQKLVRIEDMAAWDLYESHDDMAFAYNERPKHRNLERFEERRRAKSGTKEV